MAEGSREVIPDALWMGAGLATSMRSSLEPPGGRVSGAGGALERSLFVPSTVPHQQADTLSRTGCWRPALLPDLGPGAGQR